MYVPSEFHGIYLKIQTHRDWPVSGYLVITNEKKKYRTLLCLTTKQQLSSAQFPTSKATVFVFVDRCHVHTAYMCVKMAYMY